MKTAIEMVERMEALVRKMADEYESRQVGAMLTEARAIVSELPEPVDPDLALAKELAAIVAQYIDNPKAAEVYRNESRWDRGEPVSAIVAALRRAREEGVRS